MKTKIKPSTFPLGGIHPRSLGFNTMDNEIKNADLPHFVSIPLSQHIGVPANAVVKPGDIVKTGDVIGESSGFVSVNIHSSVPGKVLEIKKGYSAIGSMTEMVVIEFEGELNMSRPGKSPVKWKDMSCEDIIKKIKDMGIVGLGGATFPTHIKYSVPSDKKITELVINAVECEPYLSADYRVMLEKIDDMLIGIEIAKKLLNVKNVYIGIEDDKPEAIQKISEAVSNIEGIEVVDLQHKYPQGGEKQLIKAILGREVPSGGLPLDVGVVVSNIGTIVAVKEAVVDGKPLTERVVTVTGSIVKNPGNYKIKIGTMIKDVLEEVGLIEDPGKIVMGGPMMGLAQYNDEMPVTKGTSGILVLSKKQAKAYHHAPCVRCGKCISVCPMGLDPTLLCTSIELDRAEKAIEQGQNDCIECGCCSYTCPSQKHLAQTIKLGKLRQIARRKGEA